MRKKRKRCFVTDADRCRLGSLLECRERRSWGRAKNIRILDGRLEDAVRVAGDEAPESLVTMNSTVDLVDVHSGEHRRVTLAYPEDCEFLADGVSVLEPLGLELLGREIGDIIDVGSRRFRLSEIVYQPETVGALHL